MEERETPTEGEAQLRKVPVAITQGWHGIGSLREARFAGVALHRMAFSSAPMPAECRSMPLGDDEESVVMCGMSLAFGDEGSPDERADSFELESASPRLSAVARKFFSRGQSARPTARTSVRPLDRVVALQAAHGSWQLDDDLARALGWKNARQLRKAFGRKLSVEPETRAAATALALLWLERECQDSRDEWRILAEKGREWLDRTPEGADAWLALAREALERR